MSARTATLIFVPLASASCQTTRVVGVEDVYPSSIKLLRRPTSSPLISIQTSRTAFFCLDTLSDFQSALAVSTQYPVSGMVTPAGYAAPCESAIGVSKDTRYHRLVGIVTAVFAAT